MRKTSLLLVALMSVSVAFAQISTGEPNSSVIPRTGNRPQAGDFGMYLGVSVTQIMDLVELNKDEPFKNNIFWALPMINLKYYFTDKWEGRLGFQFACKNENSRLKDDNLDYGHVRDINYTRFLPGCAYHFNPINVLDVYLGAQMPIGFNIDSEKMQNGTLTTKTTNNKFVIGGGIFLGLQFFVADLPFAIGFEGGYSGQASFSAGQKTKINDDGNKQTSVTIDGRTATDPSKASHIEATWGADAAITFTYYFRK
jgi:hypothetical protein